MPLWPLALNFSWEIINSVLGYKYSGLGAQVVINIVWAIFDAFIVITYFRFGYRHAPKRVPRPVFLCWSVVVFAAAAIVEYAFVAEFGLAAGRAYAAFLQNLLMSVLFIAMLVDRNSSDGQSQTIAVCKGLGTLCPTLLFGLIGGGGLDADRFLLTLGLQCFIFDTVYVFLLARMQRSGALFG
jgi:hypothetical protein